MNNEHKPAGCGQCGVAQVVCSYTPGLAIKTATT